MTQWSDPAVQRFFEKSTSPKICKINRSVIQRSLTNADSTTAVIID